MTDHLPPTPSQTIGPFFGFALPFDGGAEAAAPSDPDSIRIEGQLFDGAGEPVPDGLIEVWEGGQLARCRTDPEGSYGVVLKRPATGYYAVTVFVRGLLRHLATRIYLPETMPTDPVLDPVLARVPPERRTTLIAGGDEGGLLHFDIRLQGDGETVFFEI